VSQPTSYADFMATGCMRCSKGGTDACKVRTWEMELTHLHALLEETELVEEIKWSFPTYTLNGKIVVMLGVVMGHCSLNFWKGSLMDDPHNLLVKAGENTQTARQVRFESVDEIRAHESAVRALIASAIDVERQGLKDESKPESIEACQELLVRFEELPTLKSAFEALTPGRQRAYHLHFSQAKLASTRRNRILKWEASILAGEGMHDAYRQGNKNDSTKT